MVLWHERYDRGKPIWRSRFLHVGFAQAGSYSIIITNAYGAATGGPVTLTVVDTIPPAISACARTERFLPQNNCQALLPDFRARLPRQMPPVRSSSLRIRSPELSCRWAANITFTARDSSSNSSVCFAMVTVAGVPKITLQPRERQRGSRRQRHFQCDSLRDGTPGLAVQHAGANLPGGTEALSKPD